LPKEPDQSFIIPQLLFLIKLRACLLKFLHQVSFELYQ
jgi:hypothetical protein